VDAAIPATVPSGVPTATSATRFGGRSPAAGGTTVGGDCGGVGGGASVHGGGSDTTDCVIAYDTLYMLQSASLFTQPGMIRPERGAEPPSQIPVPHIATKPDSIGCGPDHELGTRPYIDVFCTNSIVNCRTPADPHRAGSGPVMLRFPDTMSSFSVACVANSSGMLPFRRLQPMCNTLKSGSVAYDAGIVPAKILEPKNKRVT
jgi:hypothetical protein